MIVFVLHIAVLLLAGIYLLLTLAKTPKAVLLSPTFYLCGFSIFYLGLPYVEPSYLFYLWGFPYDDSVGDELRLLSIHFVAVFCLAHAFWFRNGRFHIGFEARIQIYPTIRYLYVLIILAGIGLSILLLIQNYGRLLTAFSNRVVAHEIYTEIANRFRLPMLFWVFIIVGFTLTLDDLRIHNLQRRFALGWRISFYFLPTILLCVFSLLSGDRDFAFNSLVCAMVLCAITLTDRGVRRVLLAAPIAVIFLIAVRYVQNNYVGSGFGQLRADYVFLSEFYHTGFTTSFIVSQGLFSEGDLTTYILSAMFKPVAALTTTLELPWYADIISAQVGRSFGLAGNVISESLYYGGVTLAIVWPFVIVTFVSLWSGVWKRGSYLGFCAVLILIPMTRLFLRGSFLDNYASISYWIFMIFAPLLNFLVLQQGVLMRSIPGRRSSI